jgi:tetratricopeptide (TPR) repeat protein
MGNLLSLEGEGYRRAWNVLRRRYPNEFKPSQAEFVAWSRKEAHWCMRHEAWEEAIRHLTVAIDQGSPQPGHYAARGDACAELEQYRNAARDFSEAVKADPGRTRHWHLCTLSSLAAGNQDKYRQIRARMASHFADTTSGEIANMVAYTCLPGPSALNDFAPVKRLADYAVAEHPDNSRYVKNLGRLLYRTGDHFGSVQRLKEGGRDTRNAPDP